MTKMPQFESLEQMAEDTADKMAEAAAHAAFRLFRDKQFRRLAEFDKISQGENDRIFNELVLAFLILLMLVLEAPDLRVEDEIRAYCRELQKKIGAGYIHQLKALGIEEKYLKDWEKLIGMRYAEYAKDRHSVRAAAMQLESAEKDLDVDDLAKIQLLLPVQSVAIGSHCHICRGKTEGKDELFKLILKALSPFYVEIRVRLEGGRITWLTRVRVACKRILRRILARLRDR